MELEIRTRRLNVSEPLRKHIERRLRTALGRFRDGIGQVRVFLRDVNGPRGGIDKRCRVVVHLPTMGRAVVSGAGDDAYDVVTQTAARSGRAVQRRLRRRATARRNRRRLDR